ncbi:MAG: hypothetical protein HFI54_14315 [Lachnospiraceae bacterium]|nr:hypothetical protein [Lachnospiraceae bacterium]
MRKKILSIILIIGITASLAACGSGGMEKKKEKSEVETVSVEPTVDDVKKTEETEEVSEPALADNAETETSNNADDFEEQKDIFIVKHIDTGDGTEIDFTNQEIINGPFTLGESVDIYSFYFTYAGYTKPNIKIDDVWKVDEWIVVPFAQSSFLVKEEDFNRVATLKEKSSTTEDVANAENGSAAMEQNTAPQEKTNGEMASAPEPVVPKEETPVSAPVTTYSEAEVISIFRSTLESNGIQWYPNVFPNSEAGPSGGMGWGIEDISLTDPYGDAAGTVEGLQFGGDKYYYIESQGSSNGYVHLKLYSG